MEREQWIRFRRFECIGLQRSLSIDSLILVNSLSNST